MWVPVATAFLFLDVGTAAEPPPAPATSFQTSKELTQLQKCLTDKFAQLGEVVAVKAEDQSVTLVVRDIPDGPITIDLAPPLVTVTSKPTANALYIVKGCL